MIEKLYTETEVSQITGLAKATLRKRRWLREQPEFIRLGRRAVRYPESWLNKWLAAAKERK